MSWSITSQRDVLNYIFSKQAYTPVLQVYLGVSLTQPTGSNSNITEPTDPAYARILLPFSNLSTATLESTFITNLTDLVFSAATQDWFSDQYINYAVLFLANTGNDFLLYGNLARPRKVYTSDILAIPAGRIIILL